MTYMNNICADAGTANCPCPLAETGDCLICSRLAGEEKCDCSWSGLCIYNEFIQNDGIVRNKRNESKAKIVKKIRYGGDLLVLVLSVPKGFALSAANPGSFVFLKGIGKSSFSNVPVSVMRADAENGYLYLALKIISGKTKVIAEADDALMIRGVYRNGLLGGGACSLAEDVRSHKQDGFETEKSKWLIMTKGIGFAPAVNLLWWADARVYVQMVIDTEKINEELVHDSFCGCPGMKTGEVSIRLDSLAGVEAYNADEYDKVIILASDYYIGHIAQTLEVPAHKLVFCNNFHICCGEGICGACGHVDSQGNVSKMCKCREMNVKELL